MSNLEICNQWLERYGARIRVWNSAFWWKTNHAPLTKEGLLNLCKIIAVAYQDPYRELPKLTLDNRS